MPPFFSTLGTVFHISIKVLYCHGSECQGMLIKSLCLIVVYKSGYLPELCICIISGQNCDSSERVRALWVKGD